jgi:hypothetical protein
MKAAFERQYPEVEIVIVEFASDEDFANDSTVQEN